MPYWIAKGDLTIPNVNKLIFDSPHGKYGDMLIVTKCDDAAKIRINDTSNDPISCYRNLKISGIKIDKIYLTNDASSVSGAEIEILIIEEED